MATEQKYNGWKNYETWNVTLWIGNDEGLYNLAKEEKSYQAFKAALIECCEGTAIAYETPDHVAWNDSGLDLEAIEEMIKEL